MPPKTRALHPPPKTNPSPPSHKASHRPAAALGRDSQNASSPEGAKENESLLDQILSARRKEWKGRGKYKEPVTPSVAQLPKLPAGWCWAGTEQVTAGIDNAITIGPFGSNLMVKDYRDNGVSLIFVREIRSENFRRPDTRYVSSEKAAGLSTHKVRGGDVVITKMGEPPGDTSIYPESLPDAIATSDCIKLTPNPKAATAPFLKYAIRSRPVKEQIERVTRGVAQKKMSLARFKTVAVPLAPLPEQRRIVAEIEKQFTRLEAGVAALRRVQANLKRYRAAVLKAACEGQLVPTEAELSRSQPSTKNSQPAFETGAELLTRILAERRKNWMVAAASRRSAGNKQSRDGSATFKYKEPAAPDTANLPPLPDGWTWATVEQLTSLVTSGSRGWGDYYSDSGPLFIRAQDIKTDSLKLEGVARVALPEKAEGTRSSVENNDLLVTITGANVTKSAIARGLSETTFVSQHVALLKPVCREAAAFHFLWVVSPAHGRKVLEKWAYGAGKPGLSLEQVRTLPVALPPLAEQTRIVAEVERRLSVVEELESVVSANLQRASSLRQSILKKAFMGELV